MKKTYNVYKGLQKPLTYKGFKGKYIFWGLGTLVGGLAIGSIVMSVINTFLGAIVGITIVVGGLYFTATKQKGGLHDKTKFKGIYVHEINLNNKNRYGKKINI